MKFRSCFSSVKGIDESSESTMYHTPAGDRILRGAERKLFVNALGMAVDLLVDSDGHASFGVSSFDELQLGQKLFILFRSARGLLHRDEPVPKLTSSVEAAVATVFEHVRGMVAQEIDEPAFASRKTYWRSLLLDAAREQDDPAIQLPQAESSDEDTWWLLLECLMGAVLWDNDYEAQERLDLPPEQSNQLKEVLGVEDDYYTDVPADPRDDQFNLYVDALKGLTAEVWRDADEDDKSWPESSLF